MAYGEIEDEEVKRFLKERITDVVYPDNGSEVIRLIRKLNSFESEYYYSPKIPKYLDVVRVLEKITGNQPEKQIGLSEEEKKIFFYRIVPAAYYSMEDISDFIKEVYSVKNDRYVDEICFLRKRTKKLIRALFTYNEIILKALIRVNKELKPDEDYGDINEIYEKFNIGTELINNTIHEVRNRNNVD